eukprot:gb/GECG01009802.1/.p1 GENE.gb/GECG01009802.1/~~gb/GECG01009802.1/.p1  ORF type:complete len:282 (+),score=31.78 gb/GECG01009802.1/:1-846(+)
MNNSNGRRPPRSNYDAQQYRRQYQPRPPQFHGRPPPPNYPRPPPFKRSREERRGAWNTPFPGHQQHVHNQQNSTNASLARNDSRMSDPKQHDVPSDRKRRRYDEPKPPPRFSSSSATDQNSSSTFRGRSPQNNNKVEHVMTVQAGKTKQGSLPEDDPHRIQQRQRQIDFGKNTAGYDRYIKLVPKHKRKPTDPQTPNPTRKYSKRMWDSMVRTWRKRLHQWDPPEEECQYDLFAELEKGKTVSRSNYPITITMYCISPQKGNAVYEENKLITIRQRQRCRS